MFRLVKKGDFSYYKVDSFEATGLVSHMFTTKSGGVSEGDYCSMNFRFNCSDLRENVLKNFEIAATELGTSSAKMVLTNQVHETNVVCVDSSDCGNGILFENKFQSADALICAAPGVVISAFYADCVPVLLLDKKGKAIASVHSGWRGTVGDITGCAIDKMINKYQSAPEDILVAIGPAIGVCHYEVSFDVADAFLKRYSDAVVIKRDGGFYVDMRKAITESVEKRGVPYENITVSDICTYCNSDTLFSHRATGGRRGNMGAFIMLNGEKNV